MRTFLIHLLMLLMLTPGLVCGPFMAAGEAQAAVTQMPDMPDCHGMEMGNKETGNKKSSGGHYGTMLFKDCAKVDLYSADHIGLKKPDMGKSLFTAWADAPAQPAFVPAASHAIRGPPFDARPIHINNHDLYLTTQRLRI